MNLLVDVRRLRIIFREKVGHWVFFDIPVGRKDPVVIWKDIARNLRDVVNDLAACVSRCFPVNSNHLLAVLLEGGDLRHVGVVKDVKRLGNQIGVSSLRQGSRVRVADQRGL